MFNIDLEANGLIEHTGGGGGGAGIPSAATGDFGPGGADFGGMRLGG